MSLISRDNRLIPSPSDGVLDIGPLSIHAYGLMIAIGVVAAVWLAGRRMEAAGVGTRDDMSSIALWAVGAGVVGSRLYYIVTDKSQPWKEPLGPTAGRTTKPRRTRRGRRNSMRKA